MGVLSRRSSGLPDVLIHEARYERTGRHSYFDVYAVTIDGRQTILELDRRIGGADATGRLERHVVSELVRLGYPESGELRWC
jgi:RecB family endonuclease NucS